MSPDDFMSLAIRLSASSGEAERRSAISRAYYSLFHSARLLIADCGVHCPVSAEAHDKVAKCLLNSAHEDLIEAGRQLGQFRTFRNHADYHLSDVRFSDGRFIQIQIGIAQAIHTTLSRVAPTMALHREPLRAYARDVLRLSVDVE